MSLLRPVQTVGINLSVCQVQEQTLKHAYLVHELQAASPRSQRDYAPVHLPHNCLDLYPIISMQTQKGTPRPSRTFVRELRLLAVHDLGADVEIALLVNVLDILGISLLLPAFRLDFVVRHLFLVGRSHAAGHFFGASSAVEY